jgi:hypothetical protein
VIARLLRRSGGVIKVALTEFETDRSGFCARREAGEGQGFVVRVRRLRQADQPFANFGRLIS